MGIILIENMDYVIRIIDMPGDVHGLCIIDEDNRANIYLNSRDSLKRQLEALKHEFMHFVFNDHYIPAEDAERINQARANDIEISVIDTGYPQGDTVLYIQIV